MACEFHPGSLIEVREELERINSPGQFDPADSSKIYKNFLNISQQLSS